MKGSEVYNILWILAHTQILNNESTEENC
jgi:hypothetical protein